jgi:hypothetical protein
MKTTCILFALFLVGCTSTRPNQAMTAEQATSLAMRLANDKAFAEYYCKPFHDGRPAQFRAEHWVWTDMEGLGKGDIRASVDLAADGSVNRVQLEILNNEDIAQRLEIPKYLDLVQTRGF